MSHIAVKIQKQSTNCRSGVICFFCDYMAICP